MIVAEVGINHGGSIARARQMVRAAASAGVEAVKFGVFKADEFCAKSDPLYETFKSCELPNDAWYEIQHACDREGVIFFATPQNRSDLDVLLSVGVPFIKLGSDDLCNTALIEDYASEGLPMILSTGMADPWDIRLAVKAAEKVPLTVCVCTSEYPTPKENVNVARVTTLRAMLPDVRIGFSDHSGETYAAPLAAALGAEYFEVHFTLDRALHGPDHHFSLDPAGLAEWVQAIRRARVLLGSGAIEPTAGERENRKMWRRVSGQKIRGEVAA